MRILYVSVHSVLEDDEIRMFKRLGHDVFPLGVNFGFQAIEPFRDSIVFNERETALMADFHGTGCAYRYGAPYADQTILTEAFVRLFDVVIVMHDLDFLQRFWPVLSVRPVVWRTIGQNIEASEPTAAALKARGMHIVRYSPLERQAPGYCGETALIRFGKNEADYGGWTGGAPHILTFANLLRLRYPFEAPLYFEATQDLPAMLGGVGNDGEKGVIPLLTDAEQKQHYAACRAYFYCSGAGIPYTLNFIEAMMTGIPVVAMRFHPHDRYYEVPDLLSDGTGAVADSPADAHDILRNLLDDHRLAAEMGARGRERALRTFGFDRLSQLWEQVLTAIR